MAHFILIQGIIATLLALIWAKSTWVNASLKLFFILQVVWAAYLLFGPQNLITVIVG